MTLEDALREVQRPSVNMVLLALSKANVPVPQSQMDVFFTELSAIQAEEQRRVAAIFDKDEAA